MTNMADTCVVKWYYTPLPRVRPEFNSRHMYRFFGPLAHFCPRICIAWGKLWEEASLACLLICLVAFYYLIPFREAWRLSCWNSADNLNCYPAAAAILVVYWAVSMLRPPWKKHWRNYRILVSRLVVDLASYAWQASYLCYKVPYN